LGEDEKLVEIEKVCETEAVIPEGDDVESIGDSVLANENDAEDSDGSASE